MQILRSLSVQSQRRDESRRPLAILNPWDADRLYRAAHARLVGVFQTGSSRALLDPLGEVAAANSIPLRRLVRYKTAFIQFDDGATTTGDQFSAFDLWCEEVHCDGDRDSRALPLHIFSPRKEWDELYSDAGKAEFAQVHGSPSKLTDERQRQWNRPNAHHGHEELHVGNQQLPKGFHWDVLAARNTSYLTALTEKWKFDARSYANVSPDGHVRGGQSGFSAHLVGRAARPTNVVADKPKQRKPTRKRRSK